MRLPVARTKTFTTSGTKITFSMLKPLLREAKKFYEEQESVNRLKIQLKVTIR